MTESIVDHRTHAMPRAGGEAGDYEDAAAVEAGGWPICAAVADGATESVFARAWARRLVRGVVEKGGATTAAVREAIADGQAEWQTSVRERSRDRPWYVSAKAAEGAFATVLGLSLHAGGQWRAVSVGDCCLFHLRNGTLLQSWPFDTPDSFTNRPPLVTSRPDQAVPALETTGGAWQTNDRFLLTTDAVAAWLLEGDPAAVGDLAEEAFRRRVGTAREEERLRNDDATLLVLELKSSPEPNADASMNA